MKIVVAALAGALVAGVGVYAWRNAELADRQARLLDAAERETQSEMQTEELATEVAELRDRIRRLQRRSRETPAPSVTTEPDGRYFGYIQWVDLSTEPPVLVIDFAEFLTGPEAQRAAEDAGVVEPGDPVPNDYFIRNVNPMLRTLEISAGVQVRWLEELPDLADTTVEELERAFRGNDPKLRIHQASPWWITIESGAIVEIEEQYLP